MEPIRCSANGQHYANNQYIGYSGSGVFNHTGGTNANAEIIYLGYNPGSSGTYNLSGQSQLSPYYAEFVGYSGSGYFKQTGGSNSMNDLYLGNNTGSSGAYSMSGLSQLSAYTEYICGGGSGSF